MLASNACIFQACQAYSINQGYQALYTLFKNTPSSLEHLKSFELDSLDLIHVEVKSKYFVSFNRHNFILINFGYRFI